MSPIGFDEEKLIFCQIVAQLIISDAAVTDAERLFLERLMDRLGLDKAEKKAVVNAVDIGDPIGPRLARLGIKARRLLLNELEAAAAVDGHIARAELEIIEEVRRALNRV